MSLHPINGSKPAPCDSATYHATGLEIPRGQPGKIMSRSELAKFDECPAKWILGEEDKQTNAMEWGDLMDARVTDPAKLDRFSVAPETYPAPESKKKDAPITQKPWSWNATFCKEWRNEQEKAGLTPIDAKTWQRSQNALVALDRDYIASDFLKSCEFQVCVRAEWHDVATGIVVPLKCLIDLLPKSGRYIGDFKTTGDASPRAWRNRIFEDGLHVQAALYKDMLNVANGFKLMPSIPPDASAEKREERKPPARYRDLFVHIIQESKSPYMTARRMLSEEFLELGRLAYRRQLERYCRCLASNEWPDFDTEEGSDGPIFSGFRLVEPATWMIAQ